MAVANFSEDSVEQRKLNEELAKEERTEEYNNNVANDTFYPSGNEQAAASLTNLSSDGFPLQVGDEYSANNEAYINGRTNKFQDFNSNKEYGNRSIRIQPGFKARGDNDDSGLIGRGGTRQYYTGVDKETGIISVYRSSSTLQDDPIGYYDKEGVFHALEGRNGETFATDTELAYFNGEEVIDRNGKVLKNGDEFVIKEALKQAEDEYKEDLANGDAPPPDIGPYELYTGTPYEESDAVQLEEEVSSNVEDVLNGGGKDMNARKKYRTDLEFPTGITDFLQDKLKITVMKFEPAEIGGGSDISLNEAGEILTNNLGTTLTAFGQTRKTSSNINVQDGVSPFVGKRKAFADREILGSVVLPIPDGVTDFNAVQYADGTMNPAQMAASNIALKTLLEGGGEGGTTAAELFKTAAESGDLPTVISTALTASAVGTDADRLLARTRGKIFNNNLQLLFSGPTLRPFNFQYDISPRNQKEADDVKRIIRMFKQSMAVQRDDVGIFLGSPNTYRLEFLDAILDTHPYLPIIKECALLNFSVNYMPTNSYMTYDDSSMVVYRLNFSFKELDPIYNDDYGNLDGSDSADMEIGF